MEDNLIFSNISNINLFKKKVGFCYDNHFSFSSFFLVYFQNNLLIFITLFFILNSFYLTFIYFYFLSDLFLIFLLLYFFNYSRN